MNRTVKAGKSLIGRFRLLACLLLLCTCTSAWAEPAVRELRYDELPVSHRLRYEAEMASALANARSRAPGEMQLFARERGEFNGYTGSKTMGDLSVRYIVSDSVVTVGETVHFTAELVCTAPPMIYTVGGVVMNEDFKQLGTLVKDEGASAEVNEASHTVELSYTPRQPGYANFVLIVTDKAGNQVAMTTNTVQVYDKEEPLFNTVGVDGSLGLILSMDSTSSRVGQIVTAAATFSAKEDPVAYTTEWKLLDDAGNVVDTATKSGSIRPGGGKVTVQVPYQPLQAGKIQLVITATDGAGHEVRVNTPHIPVADGFFFQAELNQAAVSAGERAVGAYRIHGHQCSSTNGFIGWACYGPDDPDTPLQTRSTLVDSRSGQDAFTPRLGDLVEFYVGATCEHFTDSYPVSDTLTLLYGMNVTLVPTADSVHSGSAIGVEYTVADGLEPYLQIAITGYSRDASSGQIHPFVQEMPTDAEGTVHGTPRQGDEVYFELTVVEADGFTSTWTTQTIPIVRSRLPGDADGNGSVNLKDALLVLEYGADSSVTLNASNADVNADGKVDSRDALLLLKHAAGWRVGLE